MIIQFENVSFRYPGNGQYALKNISFSIRTGETLSIVGDNGAGKTTLLCLLLRLFDPTEGTITLNGVDLREYPYEEYRKLLAPVFQDGELFSYSLRENVVFDKPVDKVRLWDCYAAADLKKKIDSLSSGDDTVMTKDLDENGEELSGGETQKVFMARAYFHGGEILILDEPTAAIDPISEHKIYQKVAEYRKGKICVFITHRLTSTLFADKIIVLENGNMVQMGSHKNLIKEKGLYAEMFEKQAHYYRD
ncbi:MAG: ATP-binding cassette domain-containing protein [Eubacteriales bacterium]